MTQERLDQLAVEVARTNLAPVARVDQVAAEVMRSVLNVQIRVDQLAVEVIRFNDTIASSMVEQLAVEVLAPSEPPIGWKLINYIA